jgi:soluble cytochrome b562
MKITTQSLASILMMLPFQVSTAATIDMGQFYDEQTNQTNAVDADVTNYSGGYAQFVTDIDKAYQQDRGGVIDEWVPYTTTATISISGTSWSSGIGNTGVYDATTPANTVGNFITFDDGIYDWEVGDQASLGPLPTSDRFSTGNGGYAMLIGTGSQGTKITTTLSSSDLISAIGFTLLAQTSDYVTATVHFTDGSEYMKNFKVTQDIFFGAEAPMGESVDYFVLSSDSSNKIFIDDIGVITTIPEPGSIALLGLTGLGLLRRKR